MKSLTKNQTVIIIEFLEEELSNLPYDKVIGIKAEEAKGRYILEIQKIVDKLKESLMDF